MLRCKCDIASGADLTRRVYFHKCLLRSVFLKWMSRTYRVNLNRQVIQGVTVRLLLSQ
jgi:hypothetical protein